LGSKAAPAPTYNRAWTSNERCESIKTQKVRNDQRTADKLEQQKLSSGNLTGVNAITKAQQFDIYKLILTKRMFKPLGVSSIGTLPGIGEYRG